MLGWVEWLFGDTIVLLVFFFCALLLFLFVLISVGDNGWFYMQNNWGKLKARVFIISIHFKRAIKLHHKKGRKVPRGT